MALTFEEFRATGRDVSDLAAERVTDIPGAGRVYALGAHIYERPAEGWESGAAERWYLLIGNSDYLSDDLELLERRLFQDWYLCEAGEG